MRLQNAEAGFFIHTADHFMRLDKVRFLDSATKLKKKSFGRNKSCTDRQSSVSTSDTCAMNLSTSGPFPVMMDESSDVSSDKNVYIMIRYFDQDSRLVKKTIFWQSLTKRAERFLHHLISFHRLPRSQTWQNFSLTQHFQGSASTFMTKKHWPFYIASPVCHFCTFDK